MTAPFMAGQRATADAFNDGDLNYTLASNYRTTNITTSGTTELQVVSSGAVSLLANSAYRIRFVAVGTSSTASDQYLQRIRYTNTSGSQLAVKTWPATPGSGLPYGFDAEYLEITTTATSHTYVGTIARNSGSGTLEFGPAPGASTLIIVTYAGPSSLFVAS